MTAALIAEWRDARKAGKNERTGKKLSAAAINRPLALLRTLLRLAHEEWETLAEVPKIRLEEEPQGRLRLLTQEEAQRLIAAASESRNADLVDLIELALYTGMRQAALLHLTWDRFDRARGVVLLELRPPGAPSWCPTGGPGPPRPAPPSMSIGAPAPDVTGATAQRGVTGGHWLMSEAIAGSWPKLS